MATATRKSSNRKSKSRRAPWEKAAPKKRRHTRLSAASKRKAKASAKRAGRPYPSLVDNMNAAKSQRSRKPRKSTKASMSRKPRKPTTAKKSSRTSKARSGRAKRAK